MKSVLEKVEKLTQRLDHSVPDTRNTAPAKEKAMEQK